MGEQGYNGWANYPTWATALWIDNERWAYDLRREMARAAILEQVSESVFGDRLKEMVTESLPEIGASLGSDLLGYAVDLIDWHEIAKAWLVEERSEIEWEEDSDNSVIAAEIEDAQAEGFDVSSSASRQHWIETGEFLRVGEALVDEISEEVRAEQLREETARHMRGLAAEERGESYAVAAGDVPDETSEAVRAFLTGGPVEDEDPMDEVVAEIERIRASLHLEQITDAPEVLRVAREALSELARSLS